MTPYGKFAICSHEKIRKPEQMAEANRPGPVSVRSIVWIASSKRDLSAMPRELRVSFGLRLYELQQRKTPFDMKPLPQFGAGVYELRETYERNAYRLMCVVNLTKALYVLHAFMKKSKSGIGLPKSDAELIAVRLRRARELDREE